MPIRNQSKLEPYRPAPLNLPNYRPYSRSKTSYANMNNWMGSHGHEIPSNIPVTLTDSNWRYVKSNNLGASAEEAALKKHIPNDDDYYRRYLELASKKAYRYPDPGSKTVREGNHGGSWRHVKQVLGDSGGHMVYVDGLVGSYDESRLNEHLTSRSLPPESRVTTPLYSINRHDLSGYNRFKELEQEKKQYKPWMSPKPSRTVSLYDSKPPSRLTKSLDSPNLKEQGYRGFYQRNC